MKPAPRSDGVGTRHPAGRSAGCGLFVPAAGQQPAGDDCRSAAEDRRRPERYADDEPERENGQETREPEKVREPREAHEIRPGPPTAQAPEHGGSDSEKIGMEDEQARDRAKSHPRIQPKAIPSAAFGQHLETAQLCPIARVAEDPRGRGRGRVLPREQEIAQEVRRDGSVEVVPPRAEDDPVRRVLLASTGERPR